MWERAHGRRAGADHPTLFTCLITVVSSLHLWSKLNWNICLHWWNVSCKISTYGTFKRRWKIVLGSWNKRWSLGWRKEAALIEFMLRTAPIQNVQTLLVNRHWCSHQEMWKKKKKKRARQTQRESAWRDEKWIQDQCHSEHERENQTTYETSSTSSGPSCSLQGADL